MIDVCQNKYYPFLQKIYFDERLDRTPHDYYKKWIDHKFHHSVEVAEMGAKIMEISPALNSLGAPIQQQMMSALLMHDVARAIEIDYITGKAWPMDHGLRGAMMLDEQGEQSIMVLAAVAIHNQLDEGFINALEQDLPLQFNFDRLSQEEKAFLLKLRARYQPLDSEQKHLVKLCIDLVKDADKLANIIGKRKCLLMDWNDKKIPVQDVNIEDAFCGRLIRTQNVLTLADNALSLAAWYNDLRYLASKKMFIDQEAVVMIKSQLLGLLGGIDSAETERVAKIFDEFDTFIKRKYHEENNTK